MWMQKISCKDQNKAFTSAEAYSWNVKKQSHSSYYAIVSSPHPRHCEERCGARDLNPKPFYDPDSNIHTQHVIKYFK
jgi:hypothetical protein